MTAATQVHEITPEIVAGWLESGEAVLIDVREDFEHASEAIEGATLMPLSKLEVGSLRDSNSQTRVVFYCRSGRRSKEAAQKYAAGESEAFCLGGGIEGWKSAGRAVKRSAGAPGLEVMRQVQITAGSLVVIGVVLGVLVSPWALVLSGFVGCGLVFAGASGWCGMAKLLGVMPWNKRGCSG